MVRHTACTSCTCRYPLGPSFACAPPGKCPQGAERHCGELSRFDEPIGEILETEPLSFSEVPPAAPRRSPPPNVSASTDFEDAAIGHLQALMRLAPGALDEAKALAASPDLVREVLAALDPQQDGISFGDVLALDVMGLARAVASQYPPSPVNVPEAAVEAIVAEFRTELAEDLVLGVANEVELPAIPEPLDGTPVALLELVAPAYPYSALQVVRHRIEMLDAQPPPYGDMTAFDVRENGARWARLLLNVDRLVALARAGKNASFRAQKRRLAKNVAAWVTPAAAAPVLAAIGALP